MPTERVWLLPFGVNMGIDWIEELRRRALMADVTFSMLFGPGEITAIALNETIVFRVNDEPLIRLRVTSYMQDTVLDEIDDRKWRGILGPRWAAAVQDLRERIGYTPVKADLISFRVVVEPAA